MIAVSGDDIQLELFLFFLSRNEEEKFEDIKLSITIKFFLFKPKIRLKKSKNVSVSSKTIWFSTARLLIRSHFFFFKKYCFQKIQKAKMIDLAPSNISIMENKLLSTNL